ncbi:MAG TPA: MFS transporter [Candidatus Acidoferrum sp.]|nr:MFS transporter [Candidatus Acidoferrum sp.]
MPALSLAALRHRDFALYAGANFLWTIGLQIQATALAWHMYEITHDAFKLGLVGLMEFLPAALLALPAGHLADRIDRRRLILVGAGGELAAGALLFALSATGRLSVLGILALALTFGVARAIATPAARALMPNLMPKEHFASAVAWSSTSWQVATIAGPGISGLLYAIGPSVAYGGAAIAFAAALVAIVRMRGRAVAAASASPAAKADTGGDLAALLAGLVLIVRNRLLLGAISLDLFAVLFSGASALIPVFAQDILRVGPFAGLALLSAQGIGAVVTALVLTQRPLARHVGRRLFIAVGVFGVAAIGFGLSHTYALSFAVLLVLGAADMVSVYVRGTLVPLATPDVLRGRVVAVESVFIGASNELGRFVAGSGAALLGPITAVLLGGSLTLAVTFTWSRLFPSLRRVDRFTDLA